jgi:hypothetical protein
MPAGGVCAGGVGGGCRAFLLGGSAWQTGMNMMAAAAACVGGSALWVFVWGGLPWERGLFGGLATAI